MKESKKSFIKDAFGSLISNDKAISSAKASPLWLTIILFFVAIILPIIPITVNSARSYGSSFISTYGYGLQKTMPKLALDMAKDGKDLTIGDDHMLSITSNDVEPSYKYVNSVTNRTEMSIFFSAAQTDKEVNAFINSIVDGGVIKSVLEPADEEAGTPETYYCSSYVVFFSSGIYCSVYAPNSTTVLTNSVKGDFKSFAPGTNLVELLVTINDAKLAPTSDDQILEILADDANSTAIFNNWKTVFNKSYISTRTRTTWLGSLVYLGVYFGLSLIMSLLIWILTRGKNNPFNYLSLLTCFKIGTWASVCPGLIGLVLGFLMPQYAIMFFIMCLGMRTMWLSMKQLRPQYQQ